MSRRPHVAIINASTVLSDQDVAPVVDAEKALEKGSPRVHEKFPDNIAFVAKLDSGGWKALEADASLKVTVSGSARGDAPAVRSSSRSGRSR